MIFLFIVIVVSTVRIRVSLVVMYPGLEQSWLSTYYDRQGSRVCVLINTRFLVPLELHFIVLVLGSCTRFFYPYATRKTPRASE